MCLLFNQTYLNEGLLPKYTYFKIKFAAISFDNKIGSSSMKKEINLEKDNSEKYNEYLATADLTKKKMRQDDIFEIFCPK